MSFLLNPFLFDGGDTLLLGDTTAKLLLGTETDKLLLGDA